MFFEQHSDLLNKALEAIRNRGYWSPFPESPSPRVYGETAAADGKAAFDAMLNKRFDLDLPGASGTTGNEVSPFGISLNVAYPKVDLDALIPAMEHAAESWRAAGPKAWVGVALGALIRINKRSFEIASAVMHTTGQPFVMAFQAGGPHAQDRALEAIAYAWEEMSHVPAEAYWEKPQGKNEPLKMRKKFRIVPRGIGLVIGCATFPTWNGYPGLFASLATGNAVIVKPHPAAVLPLAISVKIIRDVLKEAGFDPNVVTLVVHELTDHVAQDLSLRPEVKIIDFTGSSANGNWIETHARQAQVFTEKAGVNQIIVDSTNDFEGMIRNIAFSLSLYSGQMCTAPQNIYVPKPDVDRFAEALRAAVSKYIGETEKSVEILGAVQSTATLERISNARTLGAVVLDSRPLAHPAFPEARVHTPLIVKLDASEESKFSHEHFGPIAFVIATSGTEESLKLATRIAKTAGAMTMSVYSTSEAVLQKAEDAAAEAGVPLSENLTGGVFVNQSAAFSDYHGTGANPAANASLTDAAFVASRFRIAQSRSHV
jgi:phenylacetic acid degradation protein paaN